MLEQAIFALLGPLVDGRCYPDATPDDPQFPLIVYQVVGGQAHEFLDRTLPTTENYRVQVFCWSRSRIDTRTLQREVRRLLIEQGKVFDSAQTQGQAINLYEEQLRLYGTRQDFSIWVSE